MSEVLGATTLKLVQNAQRLAADFPNFLVNKGPGKAGGDGFTQAYQQKLHAWVQANAAAAIEIEKKFRPDLNYAFDYYIPAEQTVVEIALSIQNPNSEFEKDILKCLLAHKAGLRIQNLVFIGKRGMAAKKLSAAGPMAIRNYVKGVAGITVWVEEVGKEISRS